MVWFSSLSSSAVPPSATVVVYGSPIVATTVVVFVPAAGPSFVALVGDQPAASLTLLLLSVYRPNFSVVA